MPLVKSSHLRSVKHNPKTETMEIRFHDGSKYAYEETTKKEFNALLDADSKGEYFWENIREDKPTTKLQDGRRKRRNEK